MWLWVRVRDHGCGYGYGYGYETMGVGMGTGTGTSPWVWVRVRVRDHGYGYGYGSNMSTSHGYGYGYGFELMGTGTGMGTQFRTRVRVRVWVRVLQVCFHELKLLIYELSNIGVDNIWSVNFNLWSLKFYNCLSRVTLKHWGIYWYILILYLQNGNLCHRAKFDNLYFKYTVKKKKNTVKYVHLICPPTTVKSTVNLL